MEKLFTCSIKYKDSGVRRAFLVFGQFKNKKHYVEAIKDALDDPSGEFYDYRTLRTHDDMYINRGKNPRVVELAYLSEDLIDV